MKKTKVVCTIGPASNNEETLRAMIEAGMNVARFNFSHGSHETQKENLDLVKRIRQEMGVPVATMIDTKGPEIRFGDFENGKATVIKDQEFILSTDDFLGNNTRASISYKGLPGDVKVGNTLLVNDGLIELEITKVEEKEITTRVIVGGDILNHKGINAPGAELKMPFISEQDKKDIIFGIEQDYDYIALSFVRTAKDVEAVRAIIDFNDSKMKIIAKIESTQGVENLDAIIEAAKEYTEGILRRLREHEYNPALMRLYIVGGGGCLLKNFANLDADRVTINEDICATAKGYEYMANARMRKAG